MQTVIIKYQVATYSGKITITCDENDTYSDVIAKAEGQLARESGAPLPYGYKHFEIISRE